MEIRDIPDEIKASAYHFADIFNVPAIRLLKDMERLTTG